MTKQYLNIGGLIGVTLVVMIMCDILLCENIPLLSINITQAIISHWAKHWHILAVGLLPIYMAIILFGTSMMGLFLGSMAQRWLMRFCKRSVQS